MFRVEHPLGKEFAVLRKERQELLEGILVHLTGLVALQGRRRL